MKNRANFAWKVTLTILRNKFLVSTLVFVTWVTIFDTHSLIDRYNNLYRLNALKKEHEFFKNELDKYELQYKELFSGKKELEKFAREQYLMRAPGEEVYIIVFK